MIDETEKIDLDRLTKTLQTMGLHDRSLNPTSTMGMDPRLGLRETPMEFLARLPKLLDHKSADNLLDVQIKGTLGEGGMGLVQLAEQLSLGRDVAVKQVRQRAQSEESTLVLLREGWTTGLLEHPNIVPVHALGRDAQGEPAIVMKRISGTPWQDIIDDPECAPDGFDSADRYELHVEVLRQVCNAIDYAHSQGIIHRDLKPENVMLGEFGEVYVLDWGIALSLSKDPTGRLASIHDVDMPAGTPAYMAPEMVEGNGEELGIHTDIFLLGAILYEAITGELPNQGKTLYQVMFSAHQCDPPTFEDDVPPDLAAICKKAMARDPKDRFQTARDLRDALQNYGRNREARRLAELGQKRLRELQKLRDMEVSETVDPDADGEGKDGGDKSGIPEHELYRLFSECRFAFEQSREINPDGIRATEGLQQALEIMADRELSQEAHKAAALLIADFPRPNPEFSSRLEDLAEELARRRDSFATLQQIRFDQDVEVGRSSRAVFVTIMGLFWAAASVLMAFMVESGRVALTHPRTFAHIVGLTIMVSAVVYFGRRRFFKNELNKKMLLSVIASFLVIIAHRGMAWLHDIPFHIAAAHEMVMYGMAIIVVAVCLDRRLVWAGIPFVGCAVIAGFWPHLTLWLFVPANLLGMTALLVTWVWWPKDAAPHHLRT